MRDLNYWAAKEELAKNTHINENPSSPNPWPM